MKQTQAITIGLVLVAMTGILAACSKQEAVSSSSDLASRDIIGSATKPLANCNSITMSKFKLNTMIYRDSSGTTRYDLLQGKIQNMSENFRNASDYVRFFRWKVDANGTLTQDPTPIQVRVHTEDNGQAVTQYQDFLRWDQLATFVTSRNLTNATVADVFTRVRLLMDIRDVSADYDAITIAYYDGNNTLVSSSNMLLPTFYANPADYATDPTGQVRSAKLTAIHPFAAQTGLTANGYQTMANAFCW